MDLTFTRLRHLMDNPEPVPGDLQELQEIYLQLFEDAYDWAGELRTVYVQKILAGTDLCLPISTNP